MPELRDRDLVRLHWPAELRPAFDALFALDDAMADVVLRAREPQLAAIKLAWWREQLQALDAGAPPAEPRLRAAAAELLSRGIAGAELARLEDGWLELLQPQPDLGAIGRRGELMFEYAARLLGAADPGIASAGRLWALADLARRTGSEKWLRQDATPLTVRRKLRPLGVMAALALRDRRRGLPVEAEGTPGRSWTMIRHRITGRLGR
jgi:phytoene synthase